MYRSPLKFTTNHPAGRPAAWAVWALGSQAELRQRDQFKLKTSAASPAFANHHKKTVNNTKPTGPCNGLFIRLGHSDGGN